MAYYNYKIVRDQIPDEFQKAFACAYEKQTGNEYEGEANYDGDLWILTAEYIEYLLAGGQKSPSRWFESGLRVY